MKKTHNNKPNSEEITSHSDRCGSFDEFIDGGLCGTELEQYRTHLHYCRKCAARYSTWSALQKLPEIYETEIPADFAVSTLSKIYHRILIHRIRAAILIGSALTTLATAAIQLQMYTAAHTYETLILETAERENTVAALIAFEGQSPGNFVNNVWDNAFD